MFEWGKQAWANMSLPWAEPDQGGAAHVRHMDGKWKHFRGITCYTTWISALPNLMSYVSSAALLRLGSGKAQLKPRSAQDCLGLAQLRIALLEILNF